MTRNVTAEVTPAERFALYRLCECAACGGRGYPLYVERRPVNRCTNCRGEGRVRELVATCATAEAVGTALVTLGREGEWDECPVGCLDRLAGEGERKWIVKPWLPSARNISDAGRTLQAARKGKT